MITIKTATIEANSGVIVFKLNQVDFEGTGVFEITYQKEGKQREEIPSYITNLAEANEAFYSAIKRFTNEPSLDDINNLKAELKGKGYSDKRIESELADYIEYINNGGYIK